MRPPDFAHAAFANQGVDFIRPDPSAGSQGHVGAGDYTGCAQTTFDRLGTIGSTACAAPLKAVLS